MTTIHDIHPTHAIRAGDVIEFAHDGQVVSALVLLAGDEQVIVDLCDGSVPLVLELGELGDYRRFEPALFDLAA